MGISSSGAAALRWPGSIPSSTSRCARLFANRGEPAIAAQPRAAGRRMGSTTAHGPDRRSPIKASRVLHVSKTDTQLRCASFQTARRSRSASGSRPGTGCSSTRDAPRGRHARLDAGGRGAFAKVLADKGYHYQFLFARNAHHDKATVAPDLARGAQMAVARISGAIGAVPPSSSYPASTPCACR